MLDLLCKHPSSTHTSVFHTYLQELLCCTEPHRPLAPSDQLAQPSLSRRPVRSKGTIPPSNPNQPTRSLVPEGGFDFAASRTNTKTVFSLSIVFEHHSSTATIRPKPATLPTPLKPLLLFPATTLFGRCYESSITTTHLRCM